MPVDSCHKSLYVLTPQMITDSHTPGQYIAIFQLRFCHKICIKLLRVSALVASLCPPRSGKRFSSEKQASGSVSTLSRRCIKRNGGCRFRILHSERSGYVGIASTAKRRPSPQSHRITREHRRCERSACYIVFDLSSD